MPLLIYEIPISFTFKLEQEVSVFIRKWLLHLHHATSSLCLYYSVFPSPLPIKSFISTKSFKNLWTFTFKKLLRSLTGNWKVEDAVSSCENDIKISQVCGKSHHNKHGLGYTATPKVPRNKSSEHYQRYISDYQKSIDDTYAFSRAVQLQVQGQWTRWMNFVQLDFSWASLMAMPANLTSFCLVSTCDTLPSPTNLKKIENNN